MTKSLTSKLMLKQRLFNMRMSKSTHLREHLDQLNPILLDLRYIDEKVSDEYAALILLVSLPLSYGNFVQSFIVGKETVSLEEVRSSLHNRELLHNAIGSGSGTDNKASGLMANRSKDGKKAIASVVKDVDLTRLWHMRLAIMSERGMQILSKEYLLGGHKIKSLEFYEHCVFGKLHRSKFP
ncbi:hypothetical protein AXG93_4332s1200 [Marchantia polymorpha subsp. ruderalis]|uniref:GAG-pre-integrase domain-containing protein n=1 Tax=Marchantia polymorpha subsp. ruderalis TaxID=1480154 RepID=A0A176W3W8_MARPO|nr:hypothetical protein AXG93_4332s1200 [Marchantia polymorpha subsp. ruderalis]